jgi:hypothetical protein
MIVVVTDWVVLVSNSESLGKSLQSSIAELREKREKPTVPGQSRRVVIGRDPCDLRLEHLPGPKQVVPRTVDDLSELTAGREPVVLIPGPRQALGVVDKARDQVAREQASFGADRRELRGSGHDQAGRRT